MRAHRPALTVALLLCAAAFGGCHRDRCVPVCEQRADQVHCQRAGCKATCEKLHTAPTCAKELRVFETCFLALPPKDWECDAESLPVPRQEACSAERRAVENCMESPPPAPPTPAPPH